MISLFSITVVPVYFLKFLLSVTLAFCDFSFLILSFSRSWRTRAFRYVSVTPVFAITSLFLPPYFFARVSIGAAQGPSLGLISGVPPASMPASPRFDCRSFAEQSSLMRPIVQSRALLDTDHIRCLQMKEACDAPLCSQSLTVARWHAIECESIIQKKAVLYYFLLCFSHSLIHHCSPAW